jgi:hypothetical protein
MVITTPSTSCSSLRNISPEEIFLTGLRYATRWFEGRLYLCLLRHDAEHNRDLRRVLRWDPGTGRWTDVYTHSLSGDHHGRKTLSTTDSEPGVHLSTEIVVVPRINAVESIQFVFDSPHGKHCLEFIEGERGDFKVQASADMRSADRFLRWQVHEGVDFAIIEQTDGSKALVCATIGEDDGQWERVPCPDAKGYISGLVSFHGQLLIAVDNERRGFGLWKLANKIQNGAEPVWEPVLLAGAGRYLLNANVQTLAAWEDSLYIVAGVSSEELAAKYKEKYHASGFELLRLYVDGDWDLIIGTPRFSYQGIKAPLAGCVFEEWVAPSFLSLLAGPSGLFLCAKSELGFQAWRSSDGERWESAWSETVTPYQNFSLVGAYDTMSGPVLVTETCDFANHRLLIIWQGCSAETGISDAGHKL